MYIGFALEKVQMVGWSNVDFKISTIDHNTYYCSMFIIPTTGQNPNWNSPVHIAFFKIPTAKIQLIIIPTTDQNPNRNFPVQIAFFIIPTSHNPYKVKSRTQLKSLRTQLKSLPTQLKSLLTQLKSLRTQLKSLRTQLKSLLSQLKSLRTQLKSLQRLSKSQLKVQNPYGLNGVKIAKFKIPTIWMESKEAYQNPNWKFKIPTISMESKLLIQNPY